MGLSTSRQDGGGRLWFVAAALLALPLCIDATSDPDLWWHLRLGQWIADTHSIPHTELFSYTANGAPFVAHEWLAELLFWAVHGGIGLTGLAVVMALVTWSGLLALARLAWRRGASGFNAGVVLLLGAKAMQPVAGTRPQMFTFALLCWSLLLLDAHLRRGGRRVWLLVPVVFLWANLHAGFAVGVALLAIALAGHALDAAWRHRLDGQHRRRVAAAAVVLCLSALVALLNPNGADLYRFAIGGSAPGAHQLIQEWQRPDFTSLDLLPLAIFLAATMVAMAVSWRRLLPSHLVLTAIGIVAAVVAVRNIALGVALLSPTLAELLPIRYRLPHRPASLATAMFAAAIVVVVASIVQVARGTQGSALAEQFPACLIADVRNGPRPVQLFLPYGQAGFAIHAAWPAVHVYAYGNDAALGGSVLSNYVRIASGAASSPSALALLSASGTNAVITPPDALAAMLRAAGWTPIATGSNETLFTAPSLPGVQPVPCSLG